jgi:hypothetical protein
MFNKVFDIVRPEACDGGVGLGDPEIIKLELVSSSAIEEIRTLRSLQVKLHIFQAELLQKPLIGARCLVYLAQQAFTADFAGR